MCRNLTLHFILAVCLGQLLIASAWAGFGFGSDGSKSGLDMNTAYDVNTVTTVTGRVIASPRASEEKHVTMQVKTSGDTITVCVGPQSFWEAKGIAINVNDEVTAKGSLAQGQDGRTYLMAQKLSDRTSGSQVELRNDKGKGLWSGSMNGRSNRPDGGMRFRGGMMRGGGMMRR